MEPIRELLSNHPVFVSLNDAACDLLAGRAVRRDLKKGEYLALQGDVWPYLFLVVEGCVSAVKVSSEGRSLQVTTFGAGELFWGLAFFMDDATLPVSLEAQPGTVVYLWPREFMEKIFVENGRLGWELCRVMIRRMQRASSILDEMAFQPVAGRLARLLLDDFNQAGGKSVGRSLTLDEMASKVGSTREMVCRMLYRFADAGAIDVTRTEFVLKDQEGLARLADGS